MWFYHNEVLIFSVLGFDATTSVPQRRMAFLHGVGHSSSSSFARNFFGVVVPRLCLPHHIQIYIYIVRNTGVHLTVPFLFILKAHWLSQKVFQIWPKHVC